MTLAILMNLGFAGSGVVAPVVAPVAPTPRTATGPGSGAATGVLTPIRPRIIELTPEPIYTYFWALVPIELVDSPAQLQFFGSIVLSVAEPLHPEPVVGQLGVKGPNLKASYHYHEQYLQDDMALLKRLLREVVDQRLIGGI